MNHLASALFEAGCVQFGEFTLKSGLTSPIYVDLRLLVSHPRLLKQIGQSMAEVARRLTFDRIAAIPFGGFPIGVALSLELSCPLVYPRPPKQHGTRRPIEGAFERGETVLLVDDLITRGGSKLEAIDALEAAGLRVRDVLVLIDRGQGGADDLAHRGYRLHGLMQLADLVDMLRAQKLITPPQHESVIAYLRQE